MAEITTNSSTPEITTNYVLPLISVPVIVPAGLNIIATLRALLAGRRDVSLIVNKITAWQMKDYRNTYGYLLPAVVVETLWNVLLVVNSVVALLLYAREESNVMLRVWICGYSVHCVVNVVLLVMEYVKRNDVSATDPESSGYSTNSDGVDLPAGSLPPRYRVRYYVKRKNARRVSPPRDGGDLPAVPPTRWDLLNTRVSCLWWVLGFILMMCCNSSATPCLFWLTVAYLAMDVFFLVLATVVFVFCLKFEILLADVCYYDHDDTWIRMYLERR